MGGRAGTTRELGSVSAGLGIIERRGKKPQQYRLDYSIRFITSGFDLPHVLSVTLSL